jgi:hypothetical protein
LEVWIEQGILGELALVSMVVMVAGWGWWALGSRNVSLWGWVGLSGMLIVSLHGVFDVVFYVTRTLPLIGLALGFAYIARCSERSKNTPVRNKNLVTAIKLLLPIGLILVVLFNNQWIISAMQANLGALSQTNTELNLYDPEHFDDPTMDEIRQTSDFSQSEMQFTQSLESDVGNITANQRLSEIALSRGDYDQASFSMQSLWNTGQRDDVTRLLMGDSLIAHGQTIEAAEVVQGLTWAEKRIMGQAWYRYWLNDDYQRAAYAWETVLILNPDNQDAAYWKDEAEQKINN